MSKIGEVAPLFRATRDSGKLVHEERINAKPVGQEMPEDLPGFAYVPACQSNPTTTDQ